MRRHGAGHGERMDAAEIAHRVKEAGAGRAAAVPTTKARLRRMDPRWRDYSSPHLDGVANPRARVLLYPGNDLANTSGTRATISPSWPFRIACRCSPSRSRSHKTAPSQDGQAAQVRPASVGRLFVEHPVLLQARLRSGVSSSNIIFLAPDAGRAASIGRHSATRASGDVQAFPDLSPDAPGHSRGMAIICHAHCDIGK
jgi:hypothetical protein